MVLAGAVGIFAELDIEYPVLLILDGPVVTDSLRNACYVCY